MIGFSVNLKRDPNMWALPCLLHMFLELGDDIKMISSELLNLKACTNLYES